MSVKLFEMVSGIIIPSNGEKNPLSVLNAYASFSDMLTLHKCSVCCDANWPSLLDIGASMNNAESRPVAVSIR